MEKIIKIYQYDELSEESKERVRERNRIDLVDTETEMLNEYFIDILHTDHHYFKDLKFYWSLGYCQGDGLCFESDFDLGLYLKLHRPNLKQSVHDIIFNNVHVEVKPKSSRYCYSSIEDVEADFGYIKEDHCRLCKLVDDIVEDIQNLYIKICKEFEVRGYKAYEYLGTDEFAKDNADINGYEYDEEGNII